MPVFAGVKHWIPAVYGLRRWMVAWTAARAAARPHRHGDARCEAVVYAAFSSTIIKLIEGPAITGHPGQVCAGVCMIMTRTCIQQAGNEGDDENEPQPQLDCIRDGGSTSSRQLCAPVDWLWVGYSR